MVKKINNQFIKKLEWDSSFFGINIALLNQNYLNNEILRELNNFILKENINLVQYLCDCNDYNSSVLAQKNQFCFTDIRLTYEKDLKPLNISYIPTAYSFNIADKTHISDLKVISKFLYRDSRYYFDSNFSKIKIDQFYEGWLEKAVLGLFDHECYCVFYNNSPVGFCTIRYDSQKNATIGLFGISQEHRKKGLGNNLLSYVNNVLINKEINKISVVTQGRNISAQRAYQKAGFYSKATQLWYHKWI